MSTRVCAAKSPTVGPLGCHSYCTKLRGHDGEHAAESLEGEVVARWSGERPASLEKAIASESKR